MELPITLIVVFFVAVIVGGSLIVFSQDILRSGKSKLDNMNTGDSAEKNTYIEVSHITTSQVASLVKECFDRFKDEGFDETICFSVRSLNNAENLVAVEEINVLDLDGNPETRDVNASFGPNDAALFIYYNGLKGQVEVR